MQRLVRILPGPGLERLETALRDGSIDAARREFPGDAVLADLVELVERNERVVVLRGHDAGRTSKPSRLSTSLTAPSCSASTTGAVEPTESISH
jgi:hypothetical protein